MANNDFWGNIESSESQATMEAPQSQETLETPQGEETATPTPQETRPFETVVQSERFHQSRADKAEARLKEYEQWEPFISRLKQDPSYLQANLDLLRGNGQTKVEQEDPEPELDDIPTAEQVKAYNAWTHRQIQKESRAIQETVEAMRRESQVSQTLQRYAADYMRINPGASAQEAYEYAEWAISPQNVTPENLAALFRAMRAGVKPGQAQVINQIRENAGRVSPGVTVQGETGTVNEPSSNDLYWESLKKRSLRGNFF